MLAGAMPALPRRVAGEVHGKQNYFIASNI
jgi:hypothetical protein